MKLKNLFAPTIAAAVVLSSSVMMASAQGPRGGRTGGPGGTGGMVMGMGVRGGAANLVGLLSREEVQAEIEMMPDQVAGLRKMAERTRSARPEIDFRSATDEERSAYLAKMQAQQAERAAAEKDQLEELLLPKQFERLEQIALQAQGAMALLNPEVAGKLSISKEVTETMTKDVTASQEKGRELIQTLTRGDRDAAVSMREKMEEMRKELETKLVGHLSDDQKTKFAELKGEPFELAPMTFGGRGGDRGAGAGADRRGGGGEGRERGDRGRGGRGDRQ